MSVVAPAFDAPLKEPITLTTTDATNSNGAQPQDKSLELHHAAHDFLSKVQAGFAAKNPKQIASLFAEDVSIQPRESIAFWRFRNFRLV